MRRTIELLRAEARARVFFGVLAQSSFGTGAGYVALLLIAYDRFESAWAISMILIADLLPPMFLGPLLGAVADRWSRRLCAVVADVVRAAAFIGIALVGSFEATLLLALAAGAGTALFTPATLASLPTLVAGERVPAATSLYGAITDMGLAVGPALAGAILLVGDADAIVIANGATFALSALALMRLDFGRARAPLETRQTSLLAETRAGLRGIGRTPGLVGIFGASAAALFFGGLVNVAELPFVTKDLDAGSAVFAVVVAMAGLGIAAGSITGSGGGGIAILRRRYVFGLMVMGAGFFLSGLVPYAGLLLATFTLAGFGNGMMLVYERLIIQLTVPDELAARAFGAKDALTAWAFAGAFLGAGALVTALGPRPVILSAGAGVLVMAVVGFFAARAIPGDAAPIAGAGVLATESSEP